ncbi:hypothetical protein Tco_1310422 [Tanacetum coccineum]
MSRPRTLYWQPPPAGRNTIQLGDAVSTISEEYLLEFTLEYGIPESLHPELPGPEETIMDFPEGKVGVYTMFFEFANYRIPLSQFLFDILRHYQMHLSKLLVIGAAKGRGKKHPPLSRLYEAPAAPPLLGRTGTTGSSRWTREYSSPSWNGVQMPQDGMPSADSYSATDVTTLNTHMDLFNLISAPNPTKVKTETRPHAAHEVPLLTFTTNRVIDMENTTVASGSSETPSAIEKSPLDFPNEDLTPIS